jgi:hypothetical protein
MVKKHQEGSSLLLLHTHTRTYMPYFSSACLKQKHACTHKTDNCVLSIALLRYRFVDAAIVWVLLCSSHLDTSERTLHAFSLAFRSIGEKVNNIS